MKRLISWIESNFDRIGYVCLGLFFVLFHVILYTRAELIIDSDLSSEMVFAKLVSKENVIVTNNWFYSTEFRLFNMNLVLEPLFKVFTSWKLIRVLGTAIMNFLMIVSFAFMGKALEFKYIPWLSIILCGAISTEYYRFVSSSMCYTIYIIVAFLTVGLVAFIIKNRYKVICYILLGLLSFVASLNGIRELVVLSLPLLGTSILFVVYNLICRKNHNDSVVKKLCMVSVFILVCSLCGFLVNKLVISVNYMYMDYADSMHFGLYFDRIGEIIRGWLNLYGYEPIRYCSNVKYVLYPIFIFLIIFVVYCGIRILMDRKYDVLDKYMSLLYFVSSVVVSTVFVLSNQYYQARYFIPSFVLFLIVIGVYFKKSGFRFDKLIVLMFVGYVSIVTMVCSLSYVARNNYELIDVNEILEEKGLKTGYTTFWEGNVLTELSNGEIETYVMEDDSSKIYTWLQEKDHYENSEVSGEVFMLIEAEDEYNDLAKEYQLYSGEDVLLYIFPDYTFVEKYFGD